jgi:hypothetical protein
MWAMVSGRQTSFKFDDGVGGTYYESSPFMASNGRLIVHTSFDLWQQLQQSTAASALTRLIARSDDYHAEPQEEAMFAVHSSASLLPVEYKKGPESAVTSLAVCGPFLRETVVAVSSISTLTAFHGSRVTTINMTQFVVGEMQDDYCPIQALGSHRVLVLLCMGTLLIYEIDSEGEWVDKPPAVVTPSIPEYQANAHDNMCWSGADQTEFAFWDEKPIVSVWKLVVSNNVSLSHQQTLRSMQCPTGNRDFPSVVSGLRGMGRSLAFNRKFVAVRALDGPTVSIHRRGTDALSHSLDSPKLHATGGCVMKAMGDLLILSCLPGFSVSIWNMEGGTLLHHFQVNESPSVALQAEWLGVTALDCLALIWCTTKGFYVVGFPWNGTSREHLQSMTKLHSYMVEESMDRD